MGKLIDHFLIPLYKLIFEEEPPCMSHGVMEAISEITDWYASPYATFLRVFSGEKSPHVFPRYSVDNIFMQEVVYHLSTRLAKTLHRKKIALLRMLPLQIRLYEIKNLKFVDIEGKEI